MLTWLRSNLGSLFLAFFLALAVWLAAINDTDPVVERTFAEAIPIDYVGVPEGLQIVSQPPVSSIVSLRAPESTWSEISSQDVHLTADLAGLSAGRYQITLLPELDIRPAKVTSIRPPVVNLTLETTASKEIPIEVVTIGEPALSYRADPPTADPTAAIVVGPASSVESITSLRAEIVLDMRRESVDQLVSLIPVDDEGEPVLGVQVLIANARIQVQIEQEERYRLVSVIPIIEGQAELESVGYRVTEISATPATVIVFSSDPQAFEDLPGFVETVPLDLSTLTGDVERRMPLNLPSGFSLIGEQSVLIQVSIEPRESSITVNRLVEFQSLETGLFAQSSPDTVNLILTGPVPTLDALELEDVRVVVDLFDLGPGTFQLEPEVLVLPPNVSWEAPIPATIQVTITTTPPETPTPVPG